MRQVPNAVTQAAVNQDERKGHQLPITAPGQQRGIAFLPVPSVTALLLAHFRFNPGNIRWDFNFFWFYF
jgi:hypothetical protein